MAQVSSRTTGRNLLVVMAVALLATIGSAVCWAGEIAIEIAPSTLNLASNGTVVTVHTDVPYGAVDVYSVYLAGVAIDAWKADDRGYFVAKFLMDDIKAVDGLVLNDYNTFTFVALTITNEPIWGEADVMVIDRGPRAAREDSGRSVD